MGTIYIITNLKNFKRYVGQTAVNPEQRWKDHKNCSKAVNTPRYKSPKLYNAINKYGIDTFKFEVVSSDIDNNMLDFWERYYICLYNSVQNGYNITFGGQKTTTLGWKHSEESKKKMSDNRKGKDNPNYGNNWTDGQKIYMSKKKKGKKIPKLKFIHPVEYQFKDITGIRYITKNLLQFCKTFVLDYRSMKRVITGEYSHHHGFSFIQKKRL